MSVRIRYSKTDDVNVLRSVKSFQHPTNNLAKLYVLLNVEKNAYKIMDELTDEVVVVGEASSSMAVKKLAKNALVQLGIDGFEKEERSKRKSVEVK